MDVQASKLTYIIFKAKIILTYFSVGWKHNS